jgi:hypothetical protein
MDGDKFSWKSVAEQCADTFQDPGSEEISASLSIKGTVIRFSDG